MKALSIKQPYASLMAMGHKTLEIRSKRTHHRGKFLICASKTIDEEAFKRLGISDRADFPTGVCVGTADIIDCKPMMREDVKYAYCDFKEDCYAYQIENAEEVKHYPVSGQLGFFEVDEMELIK